MTAVCNCFRVLFGAALFDLVGFFNIRCNTPAVEACMQMSHLPVQHNRRSKTEAKQKVTPLKSPRKPSVLFYNTNRPVGLKRHWFTRVAPVLIAEVCNSHPDFG